jgi:hypothetical protein
MPLEPATLPTTNLPTIPKLEPKTKPSQTISEKSLPKLDYTKPEWSSLPPEATSESELDEEGFCNHYYLEVCFIYNIKLCELEVVLLRFGRVNFTRSGNNQKLLIDFFFKEITIISHKK